MQKFKWEVLQDMEWRNEAKKPGEIIIDSDNSYMRAMVHQEKVKQLEEA
jgi:hypothetical protein